MKTPESLETLVDYGIIQEVVRPLMSGKEAQVYVVIAGGQECVAKVYKESNQRTFKHRVEYTEGRKTRNSRDQRAIQKRTRHGRKQDEAAWKNAEVDTLYRVRAGGVRVPEPLNFVDGVLVMELVRDADGSAAPRLGDLDFRPEEAYEVYQKLIREVVRMLCAGTIHGDLSEFNVLMAADGPVVIDFPQSVDPSKNQSARKLLLRDVENLHRFLARHAPGHAIKPLGEEMWSLYEKNGLHPTTELLGDYVAPSGDTNMDEVLALIQDANDEELNRRDARGDDRPLVAPPQLRRVVDFTLDSRPRTKPGESRPRADSRPPEPPRSLRPPPSGPARARPSSTEADERASQPRGRRRRPRNPESGGTSDSHAARRGPAGPANTSASEHPRENDQREPGERNPPSRCRRRRRSTPRAGSEEQKPGAPDPAKRPHHPGGGTPKPSAQKATTRSQDGNAGRPRGRRRRPRSPGSRST